MLSEHVEKEFGGKLWSCTSCTDAQGVMKGNTKRKVWKDAHKKGSCSLFLEDLLPKSKHSWGKAINNGDPNYIYGKPKDFRDLRKKKVNPSSSSIEPDSPAIVSVLESVVR